MGDTYRDLTRMRTAGVLLVWFACPVHLNAASDTVKLGLECRQGHKRSCEELVKIATTAKDSTLRVRAVAEINDQSSLSRIANTDPAASVRRSAVIRLSDQDAIATVVAGDKDSDVRSEAVNRLKDPAILVQVARTDPSAMVRLAAIDRIDDQTVLKDISTDDPDVSIRRAALKKIADPSIPAKTALASGGNEAGNPVRQKLTVDDVIRLKRAGAADDLIIGQIQKSDPDYEISKDELLRLVEAGLSNEVIRAMVGRRAQGRGSVATPAAEPDSPPIAQATSFGDSPKIVYLPAIAYGPNEWSVVKVANSGPERTPVRLEVYRDDGSRHPATLEFTLEPQGEQETRIEGPRTGFAEPHTVVWVKVIYAQQAQDITVSCSMDVLDNKDKNLLHSVPRRPRALEDPPKTLWVVKTDGIRNQSLYVVNVGDNVATVRLCQGNDAAGLCRSSAVEIQMDAGKSVETSTFEGLKSAFLIMQTEQESKIIVMFLTPSAGGVRKFITSTSISFDSR